MVSASSRAPRRIAGAAARSRATPASVRAHAAELHAPLYTYGVDFSHASDNDAWMWRSGATQINNLPRLAAAGATSHGNAATALMAVNLLQPRLSIAESAIRSGLGCPGLPGRSMWLNAEPEVLLDVAHNPQAVAALSSTLRRRPCAGRTRAVVGMLADKDIDGMLRAIEPCIDDWHLADVPGPRGATAQHVAEQLQTVNSRARLSSYPSVAAAHGAARELARDGDRLVVFGCFYAAREALCLES